MVRGSLIATVFVLLIGLAPLAYGHYARHAQRRHLNELRGENAWALYKLPPFASGHPAVVCRAASAVA